MMILGAMRRARLQALMARQLVNWREAWTTYSTGRPMPPLRFRDGRVIHHETRDSPGPLFFEIFANGCYRRDLPGTVTGDVIDIGANIGAFTLDVAARYPGAAIHAYEADPETCRTLQRNVEANGLSSRVRVWNEAVAGETGRLTLWRGEGSVFASARLTPETGGESFETAAVTLQEVVGRTCGRVGVLKMDCEGMEADVLETAGPALDAVDYLVAEYHPWLVPDVVPRLRRVLDRSFAVTTAESRRCGHLLRARRTHAPRGGP